MRLTHRKASSLLLVTKMCHPLDPSPYASAMVLSGFNFYQNETQVHSSKEILCFVFFFVIRGLYHKDLCAQVCPVHCKSRESRDSTRFILLPPATPPPSAQNVSGSLEHGRHPRALC